MGDQAVPAGQIGAVPRGGTTCSGSSGRSPSATPPRHPRTSPPGSARPRPQLGDRVLILGHHYQRDDVMRWADARGDSFGLSRIAAGPPRRRVRRLLRRPLHGGVGRRAHRRPPAGAPARPERRLLDGRHGRHRPGRRGLGGAGTGHRHRAGGPGHLHELLGRPQGLRRPPRGLGLHLVQRPGRAHLGPRPRWGRRSGPRRQGPLLPRPAPRPQHRLPARLHGRRHGPVGPQGRARRTSPSPT